jgi:hypothetical protein
VIIPADYGVFGMKNQMGVGKKRNHGYAFFED